LPVHPHPEVGVKLLPVGGPCLAIHPRLVAHGTWLPLCGRFSSAMELSDSLHPYVPVVSSMVHRAGLARRSPVRCRASRVPHTVLPCMPGVFDPARSACPSPQWGLRWCLPHVRSASAPEKRPISGLHTRPARSPVNASLSSLPTPTHDSGSVWWARPSLSETCTLSYRAGLSRHTLTGCRSAAASARHEMASKKHQIVRAKRSARTPCSAALALVLMLCV
jgi:hypothetical protein